MDRELNFQRKRSLLTSLNLTDKKLILESAGYPFTAPRRIP